MKKSNRAALEKETVDAIVKLAQEDKKPLQKIKKQFGLAEKEVVEIMREKLPADSFEQWKKKHVSKKPKPQKFNPIEDDDVDTKYYINKRF